MVPRQRAEYLSLRREFEPTAVRLVVIAESPPASGKYFYCQNGKMSEPLFDALIKQLCPYPMPKTKREGLFAFQSRGWVIVDATYEPVNALGRSARDRAIARDYDELCNDLKRLLAGRWNEVPLVLVKRNVCKLVAPKLTHDGFNVLNAGRVVYFPSSGRQCDFARQFCEILMNSGGIHTSGTSSSPPYSSTPAGA